MTKKTRRELREMFKKGAQPTAQDYADRADSTFNFLDDGISKPSEPYLPVRFIGQGSEQNLIDFFDGDNHRWRINQLPNGIGGLNIEDNSRNSALFIDQGSNNIGLNTREPKAKLHVLHTSLQDDALRIEDSANDKSSFRVANNGSVHIKVDPAKSQDTISLEVSGPTRISSESVADKTLIDIADNGAIGVGELAPTDGTNLQVAGSVVIKGKLTVHEEIDIKAKVSGKGGDILLGDNDSDQIKIRGKLNSGHSTGKLEINDAVQIDETLNVNSSASVGSLTAGSATINGPLSAYSASISSSLNAGSATVSGTLQAGATTVTTLTASGALKAGDTTVTTLTASGALKAGDTTVTTLTASGALKAGDTTVTTLTASGAFSADSADIKKTLKAGDATISGTLTANTFLGKHSGDGKDLTNLNGSSISSGTIPSAHLPPLADNAVTTDKIKDEAVTGVKIAKEAITGANIAKATIGWDRLEQGIQSKILIKDSVDTSSLKDGAVTSAKLAVDLKISGNLEVVRGVFAEDLYIKHTDTTTYYRLTPQNDFPGKGNREEVYMDHTSFVVGVVSSDQRLKTAITPLMNSLFKLSSLQAVSFEWNELAKELMIKNVETNLIAKNPEDNEKIWAEEKARIIEKNAGTHRSFIAQELEKVFPEWVQEDKDGYKTINTAELPFILVEAIKELKQAHDEEVSLLKAQLSSLEQRLAVLEKA